MDRRVLVLQLCDYFRLDYEEIEGIDEVKMLYIYDYISKTTGKSLMEEIIDEINSMNIRLRNRRRNLNTIYNQLKITNMLASGLYDTSAKKVPIVFNWRFDDY